MMNSEKPRLQAKRRGFTLMELIVVITIIGILGTIVLVKVVGRVGQARDVKVRTDLQAIYSAAKMYYLDTGYWPESIEQLVNPKHPVTGDPTPGGLEKTPKDPWNNEYVYELTDTGAIIRCLGRDNSPSGEGEDRDYEWPEQEENL